jgi:hypothetical protein
MSIERIGNSLAFRAFYTFNGSGKTGLPVTVDICDPSNTFVAIDQAAIEIGRGLYYFLVPSAWVTMRGEYTIIFRANGTCDQPEMAAEWSVGMDWIQRLDSGVIVVSSQIAKDSKITLYRGDTVDFLEWTDDEHIWDNLTGSEIYFGLVTDAKTSTGTLRAKCTCLNPGAVSQIVRAGFTWQQTSLLNIGAFPYDVRATWPGINKWKTLASSEITVKATIA